MARVLVIGGTGMLGRPVVVRLFNDGFNIRVLTTRPERAKTFFGNKVEYVKGDVAVKQSLVKAMDGCDYVYINLKGGPRPEDYIRIEGDGSKNAYAAAREIGIMKVVQISGALVSEHNARYAYVSGKYGAEEALKSSGLTYVILRPSWFCESLPLFVQGKKAVFIGSGKTKFHFLAAADYVPIVSQCFQTDIADNRTLAIFGPESMTIPDAMRRFLAVAYPDVTINRLPMWLARWLAMFTFNNNLKALVRMMGFFNKYGDAEADLGPDEADRIFGRSATTVEEYAEMYRKIVKG